MNLFSWSLSQIIKLLRKPIESIVFLIRNAYYILRRGRSNRYRRTDRYRNEDIVQIILTINRQAISYVTLRHIRLFRYRWKRMRTIPFLTRSNDEGRDKNNTGWENWKTNRCIFHQDRACSRIANPPQIQKSIFLAVGFMFRCGRSRWWNYSHLLAPGKSVRIVPRDERSYTT